MDAVVDPNAAPPEPSQTAAVASGADVLANTLLVSLTQGVDFTVPEVDFDDEIFDQPVTGTGPLYEPIEPIEVEDFTTGIVGGTGMFDQIMVSLVNHLKVEYTASRIAGAEYTKAYIGAIAAGLQTAQQLLMSKDQVYWAALLAQQQAQRAEIEKTTARIQLEIAKAQLVQMQYEALNAEATYGLTKMQIAVQDAAYAGQAATTTGIVYTNTNLLPAQLANTTATTANLTKQGVGYDFTNANILPANHTLLKEQAETQRANTSDNRADGATVVGAVGKQKALWDQQITSYKRDSETKLAKIYNDAFVTLRTTDEELPVPEQFDQNSINSLMLELRQKLSFTST